MLVPARRRLETRGTDFKMDVVKGHHLGGKPEPRGTVPDGSGHSEAVFSADSFRGVGIEAID